MSSTGSFTESFTEEQLDYLRSQPLARLATVDPNGQPDVVPVSFETAIPTARRAPASGSGLCTS